MQTLTARGDAASTGSATWLARALLAAVLLGSCAWRLACVRAGPDPDTDAYGHFLIARQLLVTPFELRIHWVWLPLYHVLLSVPVALGATLDHVRQANALLATLPPLFLLWGLTRGARSGRRAPGAVDGSRGLDPVHVGAALLTAASPLLMQLGTTGQMEVFFCALLTLAVALLAQERFAAASLALSALVLTRYEGWAVAAVVSATLLRRRLFQRAPLGRGGWACVLGPGACVLAWATLRHLGGEPWLAFILDNQAFAERALDGAARESATSVPLALARYVAIVPWRTFGLAAVCALWGVGPTLRREGVWLVAPGAAILVFLTLSSLTRSQLGLDRHFTSVVPFAAIWVAHGLGRLVASVVSASKRALSAAAARWLGRLALAPFVLSLAAQLSDGLGTWLGATREALREPREVARFLRSTSPGARIVCADAAIEVLSELDPRRFSRLPLDRQLEARLAELAPGQDVYVVQRARHLRALAGTGAVAYGALEGPPDAFVVLRLAVPGSAHPGS